jgi:dihydrolipoamide dehydrogenase
MSDKYDIIVLGGGPGGYVAAIRAAQLGAKVALIEKDKLGGTCLNRGCIPTKALIACTNLYDKIRQSENYGIKTSNASIDLKHVIDRKNKIVEKIVKGVEFLLQKNKIDFIYGTGKVLEPGKVEISTPDSHKLPCLPAGRLVVSRKLILATGSSPASLPGINFDGIRFLSSDNLLDYNELPEKLDIVGGGIIGIHFAQIYSSLGCEITIYEAMPEILPGIDEEIITTVKRILKRKNINIITGTIFDPKKANEKTLICIGRTPNTQGIENLNLKMDRKSVFVNEKMEASIPGVYAVGDLVSRKMLAHVAYEQGVIAAENAMGLNRTFNYDCVPFGIYTSPEIGSVGLTEKEARLRQGFGGQAGENIKVGRFPFAALGIAQAIGEIEGSIKVVSDGEGKILGVHILGLEATTLIGIATVAIKHNLKVDQLAETFHAHPTYPEGLQEAALNVLRRSIHIIN